MGFAVLYFDIWQAGYAGASVSILKGGTTTLASVFLDEDGTIPAANPQKLLSMSQNGRNFGKFALPLYVNEAYELNINGRDVTGIIPIPISDLAEQDASDALVTVEGGTEAYPLGSIVGRTIFVEDSGEFLPTSNVNASASTNNATLVAAIGKAAAGGGGTVLCPFGTFACTAFEIPANVVVGGRGRGVTTLQSQVAGKVVTLSGDRAGLANITIDGVSQIANSIGVYSKRKNETRFDDILIKRFQTALRQQGGRRAQWRDLYIENAIYGAILKGDVNASGGSDGDEFRFNSWDGGKVSLCTTLGVDIGFVDRKCWHNAIRDVGFEDNNGIALRNTGSRWLHLEGCWWTGNVTDLDVRDGSDTTLEAENTVVGMHICDFLISADMNFTGKCQDIVFERGQFEDGTYTLTTVGNTILSKDAVEGAGVSIEGTDAAQWMRCRDMLGDAPTSAGVTTDATATEGWHIDLSPGQRVYLESRIVANCRNCNDYAVYHISQGAHRPGSTLDFDAQTANFVAGEIIEGQTSGATARVIAQVDSGATGTLTLRDIAGEFEDDEIITGNAGGSATANGVLAHQNAALLGGITSIAPAVETDVTWAAIFGVTAGKVRVLVTGAASKSVEWHISTVVTSG